MQIERAIPIFRMFDEVKAREFYIDFLGFSAEFEHGFADDAPLYLGLVLGNFELHLSEHYGDATPISSMRLEISNLYHWHADLVAKTC